MTKPELITWIVFGTNTISIMANAYFAYLNRRGALAWKIIRDNERSKM